MVLPHLHILAKRYPNVTAALVEIANLQAILTLPAPTVHVVSDIHGEYVKLRQVVNNASGSLRPLVARLFAERLTPAETSELLNLFYYPRETWLAHTAQDDSEAARRGYLTWFVPHALVVMRELTRRYTLKHVARLIPEPFDAMVRELLFERELARQPGFVERLVDPFIRHDRDVELVRMISRVVRNLAIGELVVAGDLGDRGPRIDKVIDILMQQPNVSITWGNHDAVWMAACLGHPAAIATVVRLSLRHQRLDQLEEGYGIPLAPLRRLARDAYGEDPAERFHVYGDRTSETPAVMRMQKAIAIIQFKLEAELFRRRADWHLEHRALLDQIDPHTQTIEQDGTRHPLADTHFPTIDWATPSTLSPAEADCLTQLTRSFVESTRLWQQMTFVTSRGAMSLRRDRCAIFHGCIPVDDRGEPLALVIDGEPRRGKALLDAIERVVHRAFRKRAMADIELLYYLWTGPLSPCFGKDKMATFEGYFLADKATHVETKNPYFALLHDAPFCARILQELGVDPHAGFIVNGHVPVKLERGETPIKQSGRAITIDGAFAAAYGDKGFSLVLDAERIYLAQHHHFESPADAVETNADIVPTVSDVQVHPTPRTVGDTEKGEQLRAELAALEDLVDAFHTNQIRDNS